MNRRNFLKSLSAFWAMLAAPVLSAKPEPMIMKESALTIFDIESKKDYRIFPNCEVSGFGNKVMFSTNLNQLPEFIAHLLKFHADGLYMSQIESIEDSVKAAKKIAGTGHKKD